MGSTLPSRLFLQCNKAVVDPAAGERPLWSLPPRSTFLRLPTRYTFLWKPPEDLRCRVPWVKYAAQRRPRGHQETQMRGQRWQKPWHPVECYRRHYVLPSRAKRSAGPEQCLPPTGPHLKYLDPRGPHPWHRKETAWSWLTWS
jgi:hypothetical protein